jgi:HAD superfamily hydrolase (TIGR01459 family)
MQLLESLDSIAAGYDAILCDVWGVVHNGRRAYAPACEALARFRANGGAVILVTNVPKPRGPIPAQFDRLGVPRDAWDGLVTSGDAIRVELEKRAPGPMHKIGPPHDAPLWEGLGLQQSDLDDAAFLAVSGLNNDGAETPADYADLLRAARARDLDLVCANPDIVVRVGDRSVWCAGALARDYEKLGGRVILAGKPHAPIYHLALRELEDAGRKPDRARILAIGDGIPTDVRGANAQNIDCLFIAGGMHGDALLADGAVDLAKVEPAFAAENVHARYAMAELA